MPKFTCQRLCWLLLLLGGLLLGSCGYYNPNVLPEFRDLAPVRIYAPIWSNATNEMGLGSRAHGATSDWLLQSGRVVLVANEEEADYILSGTISSLRYPGFSYDTSTTARALTATLSAAVSLTERESGRIIWQNPALIREESYNLEAAISRTDSNQRQALDLLVESLAEQIYLRVLRSLAVR